MSNRLTIGMLAICFIWLTACHKQRSSKSLSKNPSIDSTIAVVAESSTALDSTKPAADEEAVAPVKIKELDFKYLVAKSKVSFKSKNQDFDNTNVNIRMKQDSTIWISVTGVGLEVARGIITRDSIIFMDKIHRDYFVFNYAQLSKQYNFDLNFELLQAVIIGNLPFEQQPDSRFVKQKDFYILKQVKDRLEVDNYISESTLKLSRLQATEVPTQNTFTLDYEDFKDVSSFLFPFTSMIHLNVKSAKDQQVNETNMRIKHNKVELVNENPGFPFKVPSGYKRKR
ncbi:DUF4292 domain-containing protein [Dyadobacter luticola]|uniref:DUF4292 domain-containing protein n=1 Tax=Dyadobacter luticola TaxID=1979387 RepID=A0A5R9KNJ1_9BACT|nr:DUF4292 domain-containing protein [Dyadobacter luticola]TLU97841.1 DUF4292 domain-containing protein [Dyadobacter luticola]